MQRGNNRKEVIVYADGACIGNPGPGGFAAILLYKQHRREVTGGAALTTNNRMELMAVIAGLSALKEPCRVRVYSDSQYVVKAIQEGWVKKWQINGWKRGNGTIPNADLWQRLVDLCNLHDVTFHWIPGHSGNPLQEQCDRLANMAARQENLPPDLGYAIRDDFQLRLLGGDNACTDTP